MLLLTCGKHPDADRLNVTTVDVGDGEEPQQIVCGAPNVAAGQTVAVAKPGAIMPDGTRLKKAKLRGVPSNGMILAEDEVSIGVDHNGIMVLDDDLTPGTPLADVLPISTDVLELEITSNRPDCLSVIGLARETAATFDVPLKLHTPQVKGSGDGDDIKNYLNVAVEATDLCPRYTAKVVKDVKIEPSPLWMRERLRASGVRPINNLVDITNYVMLEYGQPMHAFDLRYVAGNEIVVRRAKNGETMMTCWNTVSRCMRLTYAM